jgi:tRNA pseudouridine32 synthase/23S rRNA pseudouridine746 synthase
MSQHLPVRDGVGPSVIVLPEGHWATVLDFLDEKFPTVSRADIAARMARGDVRDAAGVPVPISAAYHPDQKLYYYREIPDEPKLPFSEAVLFEDDLIVVADKPHFLPVTPGGRFLQETLLVRLKRRLGLDGLAPMHRIDRETAGLVLFTKQPSLRGKYQTLFEQRTVEKTYEAWAGWRGDLPLPMTYRSHLQESAHFMRMQEDTSGLEPNSQTDIALIERRGEHARYRLKPVTGKKHQLRLHMAALGLPILNDQIYPEHATEDEEDLTRPLQLLAAAIAFTDPVTGQLRYFQSQRILAGPPAV